MIPSLIAVLVSQLLVPRAEKLFSGEKRGAEKKAWVTEMVHEVMGIIEEHLPGWLKSVVIPSESAFEAVLSEAIEAGVRKLKGA